LRDLLRLVDRDEPDDALDEPDDELDAARRAAPSSLDRFDRFCFLSP
jgi:hypothetical protein